LDAERENVDRTQKSDVVDSLRQTFSDAGIVVVSHYIGITAGEADKLRQRMRAADARFQVIKNSLARRAIEGTDYEGLGELFTGPTAIACSVDPVAAAKASADFAKDNENLVILGGSMRGQQLDAAGIKTLASLPSLDELRGKLVGLLATPASRVVGVLGAPAGQLARVVGAYGNSQEAA
jgi:large subunit ribosomal protein L10